MRWTTPDPFSMRETPSCTRTALFCTVLLVSAKIHVDRHSPACKAAALGFRELRVETKRSDAGGSDASPGADVLGYPNCLLLKKK